MANLVEELMANYGGEVSKQLASNLKIDKNVAAQVLPMVAPLILGGLKRQMQDHGGAPRVDHILNKYGSDSVLDDIGGLFKQHGRASNADPRLGGLLGESGVQAANTISQQFGLNADTAMKIIPMLAPIVLGALTRKRDAGGSGSQGIASLLDQDGDGDILDDVAGFLMQGLGAASGSASSQQSAGGLLGSLLGSVLGGRKR